jgi:vacuolar-type H+-ATPase subunit I/STV1
MLSGQLNDQLEVIRNEVNKLTEALEGEVNTRVTLQSQLRETQHKFLKQSKQLEIVKK